MLGCKLNEELQGLLYLLVSMGELPGRRELSTAKFNRKGPVKEQTTSQFAFKDTHTQKSEIRTGCVWEVKIIQNDEVISPPP